MKLFQPTPIIDSPLKAPQTQRLKTNRNVKFVKYRFPHHAAPSGYDRVCDFIDLPVIRVKRFEYALGETILRPVGIYQSKFGGNFDYSRYDFTMEMSVLRDMISSRGSIYHFVYVEKSLHNLAKFSRMRNHQFVGTVHHTIEQQSWVFKSHEHFKSLDAVVTMDEASVDYWHDVTGIKQVVYIPHGVDVNYFSPRDNIDSNERFQVLFAGTHERDLETLEKVIEQVGKKTGDIQFVLLGSKLASLGEGRKNVTVLKMLSDEDYLAAIQSSDVLLLPLHSSTVCNVVLEAMACACPIITTSGGIESYLNPEYSVVANVADDKTMSEAVIRQFEDSFLDKDAARKAAMGFSWHKIAQRHIDLYESL